MRSPGMIPLGVDKSSHILVGVVSECGGIFVVNIVVVGDHMSRGQRLWRRFMGGSMRDDTLQNGVFQGDS